MPSADLPLVTFADIAEFERWLEEHAESATAGVWLRFSRKGAPETTMTKSDAIDCALAHGWVDGQLGRLDDHFYKTRFTPRRPGSAWSQANRERIEALERTGRLRPAGRAQIDRAKADGRWETAYAGQRSAAPDPDLDAALDATPAARTMFDQLDAANRFAVLYRVQQARSPEKRAAKIAEMIAMLGRGETIHPARARR
jgi:uncharacterized protein YdeI (YjbR/CyaY-like superfamily)